jgi:hypothetical protein
MFDKLFFSDMRVYVGDSPFTSYLLSNFREAKEPEVLRDILLNFDQKAGYFRTKRDVIPVLFIKKEFILGIKMAMFSLPHMEEHFKSNIAASLAFNKLSH